MEDLGAPSSYRALQPGPPVFSCDGDRIGTVAEVAGDPEADIFDGLVIASGALPGARRFVEAAQVEEIFERGVLLKLDRSAAETLPSPE